MTCDTSKPLRSKEVRLSQLLNIEFIVCAFDVSILLNEIDVRFGKSINNPPLISGKYNLPAVAYTLMLSKLSFQLSFGILFVIRSCQSEYNVPFFPGAGTESVRSFVATYSEPE